MMGGLQYLKSFPFYFYIKMQKGKKFDISCNKET